MRNEGMKILLHNIGYGLGHDGSLFDYVFKSSRYITKPDKLVKSNIDKVNRMRRDIAPDLAIYLEVDKKNQNEILDGDKGEVVNKYSKRRKDWFGNAIVTDLKYTTAHLPFGRKTMFFEVELSENLNLICFHFSLSKWIRKKQFDYFKKYMHGTGKQYVLCGDFNVFDGVDETRELGMKVVSSKPTFPAHDPKHAIDLFMVTDGVGEVSHSIHTDEVSDHLCVCLEIK